MAEDSSHLDQSSSSRPKTRWQTYA